MAPKRLFIIDAMAMAFRNFHAFGVRPLRTSTGIPTSAVFGSAQFVVKLIEEERPDYLVIASDSKEPTFRHKLYPKYKANRVAMPVELAEQLPYFYKLFDAMNCKVLRQPGVEADDLIGSLVHKFRSPDLHCYIVSGDKDFMQLIDPTTFLYIPRKGGETTTIGIEGVREKFGCGPENIIDILALLGDSSDNVPGVSGVGDKGAAKLVAQFGSLEKIYENIDQIANARIKEALIRDKDQATLAKQLVTIDTKLDLPFTLEEFRCSAEEMLASEELLKMFNELEFRRLLDKVKEYRARAKPLVAAPSHVGETAAVRPDLPREYHLIDNPDELKTLVETLTSSKEFSFDTETTGLNAISDKPIGASFSIKPGEAFYVPFVAKHLQDSLSPEAVIAALKPVMSSTKLLKIAHNVKFDLQMLNNIGIEGVGPFADTMIYSHLLESTGKSHSLDNCSLRFLNFEKILTSTLIGEKGEFSMLDAPLDKLTEYACEDADYTLRLYQCLLPKVKQENLIHVATEIEMPLVPIIAKMEQTGVFIDSEVLHDISNLLDKKIKQLEKEIFELAGEEFNINSTKKLQVILFEKLKIHEELKITRLKKTKTGFSTDVSVLERMAAHPLANKLLEYRTVTKLKNTYVDTLPQLIEPATGRVHTQFHQTGTATGRLSSSNPNLQNIPIRSEMGREIRRAFRTQEKDNVYISADYSQVELRLLAHITKEKALAAAFKNDEDIHNATAAKIFGVGLNEVSSEMRAQAKAINFGIIYGMGPSRLARETGVTFKEARDFIERYFENYPAIKDYIQEAIASARKNGYTVTLTGRKRPLQEIYSRDPMVVAGAENAAVNSPIQGSAADLIKLAMIKIEKEFHSKKIGARMLMQVHDELVFECERQEVETVKKVVRDSMESALDLDVPLKVDIGVGVDWLEAH